MTQGPRIASLLPSATEICCALGLDAQVVGVSHECNRPGPRLVRSAELAALAIHPEVLENEIKAEDDEIRFDPFQQT